MALIAALATSSAAAETSIPGYRSNYTVTRQQDGSVTVQRLRDGTVQTTLAAAQTLEFQDAVVFFDDSGIEGQAYRLYQAAFNRKPDEEGLGFWIAALRDGVSLRSVAKSFYDSPEFQTTYGQVTDTQFLTLLYRNVLQRVPDQGGLEFWTKALQDGAPRANLLTDFSESTENRANVAAAIKAGVTYYPFNGSGYTAPLQSFNPPATASARSARMVNVTVPELLGTYKRVPVENDYHEGSLVQANGVLAWKNKLGQTWTLRDDLANGQLLTDASSPYYNTDRGNITVVFVKGKVAGIRLQGELYLRDGVALPADTVPMESVVFEDVGLTGFAWHEVGDAPAGYGYGFSEYMAMYPAIDHTMQRHQVGIGFFVMPDNTGYTQALLPPENHMRASNPGSGPTWSGYFQTIEGGPGGWGDTQFPVVDPKFRIVGTPDGYANGMNSPGWGFASRAALSRDLMSIAQLSNRILTPPDGFTFRAGTSGDFFGYAWMAMPMTEKRTATVPIGNQNWTLFFNAANFRGPVAFWVADAHARLSKTWAGAVGRGLDALPARVAGTAMEVNITPAFVNADLNGTRYLRNARLLFPVDADDMTWLATDRAHYSAAALFEPVKQWFNGGSVASAAFARNASYFVPYSGPGFDLGYAGMRVADLGKYVVPTVKNTPGGGAAFGLKWTAAATPGVLPEYYRQNGDKLEVVAAADVPPETMLTMLDFATPVRAQTFTSPDSGSDSWMSPAPAAGPYSARLTDGSAVTYYWYRFVDQPSLQGFGWSEQQKAQVQARVELLHRNWSGAHEFMAPPSAGTLATMDAALLVTPPAGMEAGYVPIVTRQEAAR
jgi:hypothetical protein